MLQWKDLLNGNMCLHVDEIIGFVPHRLWLHHIPALFGLCHACVAALISHVRRSQCQTENCDTSSTSLLLSSFLPHSLSRDPKFENKTMQQHSVLHAWGMLAAPANPTIQLFKSSLPRVQRLWLNNTFRAIAFLLNGSEIAAAAWLWKTLMSSLPRVNMESRMKAARLWCSPETTDWCNDWHHR